MVLYLLSILRTVPIKNTCVAAACFLCQLGEGKSFLFSVYETANLFFWPYFSKIKTDKLVFTSMWHYITFSLFTGVDTSVEIQSSLMVLPRIRRAFLSSIFEEGHLWPNWRRVIPTNFEILPGKKLLIIFIHCKELTLLYVLGQRPRKRP